MNRSFQILIILLVLASSCTEDVIIPDQPADIYPQPITVAFDQKDGYVINPYFEDSVSPIINAMGDTILTGIPFKFKGTEKEPIGSLPLQNIDTKKLVESEAHQNIKEIPKEQVQTSISIDQLEVKEIDLSADNYLTTSTGDSVQTGVLIQADGKTVRNESPTATKTLTLERVENTYYHIRKLDVDQGLPTSAVNTSFVDSRNNIWIGTWYGGVCKYNGESIISYTTDHGLVDDYVLSIMEDSKGNLWFGTWGGVSKFNGESFTNFTENEGLINNQIWSILEDNEGSMWFATNSGGVFRLEDNNLTHYTNNEGLLDNNINALIEDEKGNIWIGTRKGLSIFTGNGFASITMDNGLSNNKITSLFKDSSDHIWIGTEQGLNEFDGKSITQYSMEDGLPSNVIKSITQDDRSRIWIATKDAGISKFDGNSFENISKTEGLPDEALWNITYDGQGNLLLGTAGSGLIFIGIHAFHEYSEDRGLSSSIVISIIEDQNNNLYLGTEQGLNIYNGKTIVQYQEQMGSQTYRNRSIVEDSKGNKWISMQGQGVFKLNGDQFIQLTEEQGLSNNTVWSMMVDSKDNVWMATYYGVSMFDGSKFTQYTMNEGLSSTVVFDLMEDSEGNIWMATNGGGLCKYDGDNLIVYSSKEGLSSNTILALLESRDGRILIGTWDGLNILDGDSITYISEKEGLSGNGVSSLIEDREGNIWVGTTSGLNRISFSKGNDQESKPTYSIENFDKNDGISGIYFMTGATLLDSENKLWWGTEKKLVSLDLNEHEFRSVPPLISLNNIEVNGHFVDFRNLGDSLKNELLFERVAEFENYPIDLMATHKMNHLTFHFSAIDWKSPNKIRYSYYLDGVSKNWSKPSTETKADFSNIPYGDHQFKVCAAGSNGKWSEPFIYNFSVLPPWWHTWWARTLYVLTLVLIVLLVFRIRTAKLIQKQKILEQEIEKATSEIIKQKEEVENQKNIIEIAHHEIKDSLAYAKRIQSAILPPPRLIKENLGEVFVLYKPKDIVAGDFYWMEAQDNRVLFAAADCTGHGVPGAMVSVICNGALNRSVREFGLIDPAKILDNTRDLVIAEFEKSEEEVKDGMDIALCALEGHKLKFAGAHNPLWIIRKGTTEVEEIKADKQPIGKYADPKPFTSHEVTLNSGDSFYTFSDGFADQFGGDKGKKFKAKNFKSLLLSLQHESMDRQKELIDEAFEDWRGNLEQLDDVCVIGVKID